MPITATECWIGIGFKRWLFYRVQNQMIRRCIRGYRKLKLQGRLELPSQVKRELATTIIRANKEKSMVEIMDHRI